MENINVKVLDEFNKAIKMGEDSYAIVIKKQTTKNLKKYCKINQPNMKNF